MIAAVIASFSAVVYDESSKFDTSFISVCNSVLAVAKFDAIAAIFASFGGLLGFESRSISRFFSGLQRSSHLVQRPFMAILNTPRGVGSAGKCRKLV